MSSAKSARIAAAAKSYEELDGMTDQALARLGTVTSSKLAEIDRQIARFKEQRTALFVTGQRIRKLLSARRGLVTKGEN